VSANEDSLFCATEMDTYYYYYYYYLGCALSHIKSSPVMAFSPRLCKMPMQHLRN